MTHEIKGQARRAHHCDRASYARRGLAWGEAFYVGVACGGAKED